MQGFRQEWLLVCLLTLQSSFPLKAEPPLWPEGNVTFGYLSALNTRVKTFNFSNNAEPLCLVHFATLALRAGSAVSR